MARRPTRLSPVAVSGLTNAEAITAGQSLQLCPEGRRRGPLLGENGDGQLGDGTTIDRLTPVAVSELGPTIGVSVGPFHTCAVLAERVGPLLGDGAFGQLGDGTHTDQPRAGHRGQRAVERGGDRRGQCHGVRAPRRRDGPVLGREQLRGSLEMARPRFNSTPVAVSGLSNAVAITAGRCSHVRAPRRRDGRAAGASNSDGQLGDGTTTNRLTPVTVTGLTNVVAVTAGDFHTCALRADGTVRCWGDNAVGQLGDGSTTDRLVPVAVSGLTNAVAVSAGGGHTCAVRVDGAVFCWGSNEWSAG